MNKLSMFCYQCEQTTKGSGCTVTGVCGKSVSVSNLQDMLICQLQGLACVIEVAQLYQLDVSSYEALIYKGLFTTVTNVNFSDARIVAILQKVYAVKEELKALLVMRNVMLKQLPETVNLSLPSDIFEMAQLGRKYKNSVETQFNPDIRSLQDILLFGIKGVAAYADHAMILFQRDPAIYEFLVKALARLWCQELSMDNWLTLLMECGAINLRVMELLDRAHTEHYGKAQPTSVPLGVKQGKAILISGHDLHDLELLLEQTQGKNIYIYTHGEMLPAHGYPEFKKYPHFYGHYGTAWQNQQQEFAAFPGAILMTTNCLQEPRAQYKNNIFTTGLVAWSDVQHIDDNKNFTPVINQALQLPGFASNADKGSVMVGFSHHAVLGVADQILDLIKKKQIRHFFLVAGCDGAKPGRNYYTELVEKIPADCMVLTLACGKFRFFNKDLGTIGGLPRLLDIGQCNDAYSAIKIASALATAFNCTVNELPLSLILSWYEQKAVAILLTLLSIGIKNIRLGPSLPAFITPNVLKVLIEKFNIRPITTPDADLAAILK